MVADVTEGPDLGGVLHAPLAGEPDDPVGVERVRGPGHPVEVERDPSPRPAAATWAWSKSDRSQFPNFRRR